MITGELKNKIDGLWDIFASGGLVNPLDVIEQITYLMFIHDLDDADNLRSKAAAKITKKKAICNFGDRKTVKSSTENAPDRPHSGHACLRRSFPLHRAHRLGTSISDPRPPSIRPSL